ncbi:hypothetical protein PR048_009072 [Dryococelus australis]|uniref:Uncharacterized protein n=1 Tax=Dryococelus australis TaxID=614101 RepID=A0ABQ9HYW3_9NEOP|nr:hypothetical protein PR048_009072 [Dryococelus australis]
MLLKEDILNGPYHVFGDLTRCVNYFCDGAVLQHNTGRHGPVQDPQKHVWHQPRDVLENLSGNRKRKVNLDRERQNKRPIIRCLFTERDQKLKADKDYGPNIQVPGIPKEESKQQKEEFLANLSVNNEKCEQLERKTRQQSESPEWLEECRKRVTARYYYHQGQLRVNSRDYYLFCIWSQKDVEILRVPER